MRYLHSLFPTKSLKSGVYFTLRAYYNINTNFSSKMVALYSDLIKLRV